MGKYKIICRYRLYDHDEVNTDRYRIVKPLLEDVITPPNEGHEKYFVHKGIIFRPSLNRREADGRNDWTP